MPPRSADLRQQLASHLNWPTLLLAFVNVAGAWAITQRVWHGSEAPSILAVEPLPATPPSALPDPTRSTVDPSAIQSGALFYASRSFYTPPVIPHIQPPPDYKLAGTLVIPQQPTVALLIQPQSGKRLKVRAGDDLNGWTVDSIQANAVMLHHADQQFEIRAARAPVLGIQRVPLSPAPHELRSGTGIRILGNR